MAQAVSMAGGPTRHRDGFVVWSPGVCEQGAERPEGTSNVQVSLASIDISARDCQQRSWQQSEEVAFRRRGLTRGATQSLKRGIVSAQERLKPLRAAQGWLHAWILLEVFSGMSELTIQAADAGWQSLQPIELMCGDDLFDPKQVEQFEEDVKAWEPDLLVMEPPCGPWCSWQNLADPERVEALRERHKPLWLAVRRAWDAQTRAGRLALTEQPQTSAALRLEEMQGRPQLHRHVTQQCAHGLKDPVSQLPYHKSTSLDTNDAEFNEFLEKFDKPCPSCF